MAHRPHVSQCDFYAPYRILKRSCSILIWSCPLLKAALCCSSSLSLTSKKRTCTSYPKEISQRASGMKISYTYLLHVATLVIAKVISKPEAKLAGNWQLHTMVSMFEMSRISDSTSDRHHEVIIGRTHEQDLLWCRCRSTSA